MSERLGQLKILDRGGATLGWATALKAGGLRVVNGVASLLGLPSTGVFDANDYGAVPYYSIPDAAAGTDSTAAFNAAIAAAVTGAQVNGGFAKVVYDSGVYKIAGALLTTGGARAQIVIPKVALGADRVYLLMEPKAGLGHAIPYQGAGPGASAMFYSTLTGQTYSGTDGWPAILGGPDTVHGLGTSLWSWMSLHIRGTAFHQGANPSLCGVNGSLLVRMTVEDCRFTAGDPTGFPAEYAEPTNPTGVALLMPIGGTDGMSYRGLNEMAGMYAGPSISELTDVSGQLFVYECKVGLNLGDTNHYHSPKISRAIVVKCPYVLATVNPTTGVTGPKSSQPGYTFRQHLWIDNLDIEEDGTSNNWTRHKYHIYDPNLVLSGYVGYQRVRTGEGTTLGPLTTLGAGYVETRDVSYPPPQRVVWQDTFTHTYAQEGNALSGRAPEKTAGGNWTVMTGFADFKLVNNRLKADTTGTHRVWANAGHYNGTFEMIANHTTNAVVGAVVRRVDDNNYVSVQALGSGNLLRLFETVAGTTTQKVSVSFADLTVGKDTLYQIVLDGTRIRVRADGAELIDYTLSAGAVTAGLDTGTGVGALVTSGLNSTVEAVRFLR